MTLTAEQEAALDEARTKAGIEPGTPEVTAGELVASAGTVAIKDDQDWWTSPQLAALAAIRLDGVPKTDLLAFLHLCQRSQLDPFAREIYLIGRWDKDSPNNTRYTAQTGIDGYRHLAERTGEYDGKEGPWWCGPDGQWSDVWLNEEPPVAARVNVYRKGMPRPITATALYREFLPTYKDRRTQQMVPMPMWVKMPSHMLAKVAEALAIRQGFPRQAAGIYVTEEMHGADAAARDAADAAAEAVRAQQRRELVGFGPGDAATPRETAPGEVVEAVVVPEVDRADLLAELDTQSEVLGKTVKAMATRWVKANRKNLDDATDVELAAFVVANRPRVATKLAEAVDAVAETTVVPDEPETLPVVDTSAATEPHKYQDWGGKCIVCTEPVGDDRHTT